MGTGEKKSVDTRSLSHSCFPSALGIGPLLSRSSPLLLPLFALAQNDLFPLLSLNLAQNGYLAPKDYKI